MVQGSLVEGEDGSYFLVFCLGLTGLGLKAIVKLLNSETMTIENGS